MPTAYFEQRERTLLGVLYESKYTYSKDIQRGITANGLRDTALLAQAGIALAPSPFCENAYLLADPAFRPGLHPYHHAGLYYVQEPSASAPAALLDVQPGEKVLDLCAAPGGKSSQLAAALAGQGLLVANEYAAPRAQVLKHNLERMGAANAVILNETTSRIAAALPGYFDKVLVDAPCSGEGMFRKEPEALRQHSEALVRQCAGLGRQILEDAAACLAPGGLLCYSTCTFAPEEDEGQVGAFLARHPEFLLEDLRGLPFGCEGERARSPHDPFPAEYTRRIYPCDGGEGHFMALLRKTQGEKGRMKLGRPGRLPAECAAFLRDAFPALAGRAALAVRDMVYLLPDFPLPDLSGLHVLRAGVEAGQCVKGRFEPAHGLFMAFGGQCVNKERLTLDDARTAAWLRGEEIPAHTAGPGFCAVLVNGCPLGGGKVSGGRVKNRYPKGLRACK